MRRRFAAGTAPIACAIACVLATPAHAARANPSDGPRPWGRDTVMPSFGFGMGFSREATSLGFGLGFRYFAIAGLGLGVSLSDSILIFSESIKSSYPGIHKQVPTNTVFITPSAQYVFFRSRWFSPFVHAGVGPAIFNNHRGVVGHWVAGPGAFIGIGGPVYLNVGVDFSGMFPSGKCNDAYRYHGTAADVQFSGFCSFSWSPNIGLVVAFGGGKKRRRGTTAPAPANPMPVDDAPLPAPSSPPPSRRSKSPRRHPRPRCHPRPRRPHRWTMRPPTHPRRCSPSRRPSSRPHRRTSSRRRRRSHRPRRHGGERDEVLGTPARPRRVTTAIAGPPDRAIAVPPRDNPRSRSSSVRARACATNDGDRRRLRAERGDPCPRPSRVSHCSPLHGCSRPPRATRPPACASIGRRRR
ncbi:MAG: hypothetical protein IPN32_06380 [Deltaproteobacteria bacterium]|nr:hypothetical protein [Deltaproteobacteria bacterium]